MGAKLLGNHIIRKSDGKKVAYIGVIPMRDKKTMIEWWRVYPQSKYYWVESRQISSPMSSKYKYK